MEFDLSTYRSKIWAKEHEQYYMSECSLSFWFRFVNYNYNCCWNAISINYNCCWNAIFMSGYFWHWNAISVNYNCCWNFNKSPLQLLLKCNIHFTSYRKQIHPTIAATFTEAGIVKLILQKRHLHIWTRDYMHSKSLTT